MYGTIVIFGWKTCLKRYLPFAQLPSCLSPCTTQKVKHATFVYIASINHHLGCSYVSSYNLKMAACMPMGILTVHLQDCNFSVPTSPASSPAGGMLFRVSGLLLLLLPLKVSASCEVGHSKWAYISYWDEGRIQQKMNRARWNQIVVFRQAYCDSKSQYFCGIIISFHSFFIDLCRFVYGIC